MRSVVTNMCMIQDEQTKKVVVQHRTKNWQGLVFPGGHVEPNESLYEAMVREVKEETGLEVSNLQLCGLKDYHWKGEFHVVVCYKTTTYTGELIQREHEDFVEWRHLDELTPDNTPRGFLDMLQLFISDVTECYFDNQQDKIILI